MTRLQGLQMFGGMVVPRIQAQFAPQNQRRNRTRQGGAASAAVRWRSTPGNGVGRDAGDIELGQDAPRLGHRASYIDAAAGILDHDRLETLAAGILT